MKELININPELKSSLEKVIRRNTFKEIIVGEDYIPVTGKKIDTTDILFGIDASMDAWLTTGRYAKQFESDLAQYIGSKKSILVNSGSSANLTAFYALTSPSLGKRAIQKGDEERIKSPYPEGRGEGSLTTRRRVQTKRSRSLRRTRGKEGHVCGFTVCG